MVPKLLLTLVLWASCMFCYGSEDPSLQVQCRANRYPVSIDCSWTRPPATNGTKIANFITTYRMGTEESKPCYKPRPRSLSCNILGFPKYPKLPHVFNVTAIYPGNVSTTLLSFVPNDIIKPDPPVIIRVSLVSENQLQVEWKAPGSWPLPEIFELKYQLRYKRCKSNHFLQVGPTEKTTLTIKVVHPKGKYCIQVNAQHPLGYGEPSEWSRSAIVPITLGN